MFGCYNNVENLVACMHHFMEMLIFLSTTCSVPAIGLLPNTTPVEWHHTFHVNVHAIYNCCRLCIPDMIKRNQAGLLIFPLWKCRLPSCEVAYSAAKSAVNAMKKP